MVKNQNEIANSPAEQNTDAELSASVGENLFNAYADLVDTRGSSFNNINTNGDQFLGRVELVSALGEEPRARHLLDNLSDIEESSNDELGDENDGITNEDLERNFLAAIEAHDGSITDLDIPGLEIDSATDAKTGKLSQLKIKDESRDMQVRYSDDVLTISNGMSNLERAGGKEYDEQLKTLLGDDLYNAYQAYQDGGLEAFDKIDYDENGTLDEQELNEFLILTQNSKDPSVQRQHEAAGQMLRDMAELKDVSDDEWIGFDDGITMNDLSQRLENLATAPETRQRMEDHLHDGAVGTESQGPTGSGFYDSATKTYLHYSNYTGGHMLSITDPNRQTETKIIGGDFGIETQRFTAP